VSTRTPTRGLTPRRGAARHPDGMSLNMYLINAILVLLVVRQIREHWPVGKVAATSRHL